LANVYYAFICAPFAPKRDQDPHGIPASLEEPRYLGP